MNYLEKSFTLRVSECDAFGRWRPGAMMIEMQEAAGEHSASISCGRKALLEIGLVWVVARMELQVIRYPTYGEQITIRTFHRPNRHRFFPRFFQIRDGEGQLIAQASSLWLLMDLENRRSVAADRLPVPLPDNSDMTEPMSLPGGIAEVNGEEKVISCRAEYTDLDANGHVNNTKYVDWLCNLLGTETMKKHPPRQMTVHFNYEVRPEQPVDLRLIQDEGRFRLAGVYDGKPAFEIGGELFPE